MKKLIVPMLLQAFLKNNSESEDKRLSLAAPNYRNAMNHSFLGSSNTPSPFNLDLAPLRCGVHLHFILPDAFTHADENNRYPAVPDRFHVTRLEVKQDGEVGCRQFVVESSFISDSPYYDSSVTIPMFSDGMSGSMFRYLGRCYPENAPPSIAGAYLEKLTAVGPGDPAFAAYYPNCHSVFGFYDDVKDVAVDTKLTYFVTGYFSDVGADPLNGAETEPDFAAVLSRMGFSVEDEKQICDRTVLFGEITGLLWKGPEYDYGKGIPQGEIDVSVGNTSAEAMAAILKEKLSSAGMAERHLTALQYALLESGTEEDGNFKIDDGIYAQQFEAVQNRGGGAELSAEKEAENIASDYSFLITKMEEAGKESALLEWESQKLFSLWEQYMYLYETDEGEKIPSRDVCIAEIKNTAERVMVKKAEAQKLQEEVKILTEHFVKKLPKEITLKNSGGESFYRPRDPAVLLSGSGINRSFAFGEDGRHRQDNTLLCQTDTVACGGDTYKLPAFFGEAASCRSFLPGADCYSALFAQAVLLSAEIKEQIEKKTGRLSVSGSISPVAVNGESQSFTTLLMDWSVRYYPTRTSQKGARDNTLSGWKLEYGETAYSFDGPRSTEKNITYTGRTVVTPHSVYSLKASLKKWLEQHSDDEEAKKAAEKIQELPVLSQSLGGLTEQLCALKHTLAFPVMGNEGEEGLAALVESLTGDYKISTVPSADLFSLRGGHFRLDRLNLISAFGQIQRVIVPPEQGSVMQKIHYAETLCSKDINYGLLTPAFTIPARLDFKWVSKDDHTCISSPDKSATPVCGFLLPEMLNGRLLAYTGAGIYIGTLKKVYRGGKEEARWVSAPGFPKALEQLDINGIFKAFLEEMKRADALAGLMRLIDVNFEKALASGAVNLLWGRPLALCRGTAALLSQGGFDYTKDYGDFGTYNTQGIENIKIPVHFGDAYRVSDGLVAVFTDTSFDKIYPAWGSERFENSRILFDNCPELSFADGKCLFTLLMEAGSQAYLQTGLLPVKSISIPAEHAKAAENLSAAAELTCVLTTKGKAQLPVLQAGKQGGYDWCYPDESGERVVTEAAVPVADFSETYLCDGLLVKRKETTDGR